MIGQTISLQAARLVLAAIVIAAALSPPAPAFAKTHRVDALSRPEERSTGSLDYDRSFVKEWEANPPKGYPTLPPPMSSR